MDKNYNVDDILAEIKRRKSREMPEHDLPSRPERGEIAKDSVREHPEEKVERTRDSRAQIEERKRAESAPARPSAPADSITDTIDFSVREKGQPVKGSVPPKAPVTKRPPGSEDDGFRFVMPPVEKVSRNPLDVDSHVRSIADKAKIRREHAARMGTPHHTTPARQSELLSGQQPRETGGSQGTEPAPAPRVIDFSAFRPPEEVLNAGVSEKHRSDSSHSATRSIPVQELSRSREFQLEEIQKLDFGAVADSYAVYDDDDDADNVYIPSATPLDYSEYNSEADREAVAQDIARVKLWLVVRCLLSGLLTGILYYITWAGKNYDLLLPDIILPENDMRMYLLVIILLTVAVALVCSSAVGGGLISLFKMRANSDTLAALALLAAVGQGVAGFAKPDSIDPKALGLYACVAALSMFFNALGKMTMISRIQSNFGILASNKKKRAVLAVQDDSFCRHFVRDSSRRPTVAYSAPAGFFTDFLGLSYSDKYDVGINRSVAPVCLIGAVLVGILTYLLTGSSATAIAGITAILCVSATLSSTFIESIPLGKLTRKLVPHGGMVSGNKAVEDFCDTKGLVLREQDLFPEGFIHLHGIKAYSHGRIDEAILDAASVLCATDSALSPVFLQMIGGNKKLLRKVENLVYENEMGISAWVNSRRILIGNQQLMQGHGIPLPQDSYDQKYAHENGEPIYLSNSGEVSAQFVVSYHIDEDLAVALDQAVREKRLIVHTVDPNITTYKLWELYGYPEELIDIMPAELHSSFAKMAAPRETAVAEIVYTGKASTMVRSILACVNARSSILSATMIQMAQIIFGYGMIAFIAFLGAMSTVNIAQLTLYQLFWFVAIYVVQKARSS